MISVPTAIVGELVEKVGQWNPRNTPGASNFRYIDLGSVDKEAKIIDPGMVSTISPSEAPSRARQLAEIGDVLVATVRPNLNGVALVADRQFSGATVSTGYSVLRPNRSKLDSKYLFYWVRTDSFIKQMMRRATGANYPAVSDSTVKGSKIPLPPLKEQKRIAAILDKADAIRRKRQQAIELTDQFLRSVFLEMFGDPVANPKGWPVAGLDSISDIQSGITKGRKVRSSQLYDIPYMRVANVQDRFIDLGEVSTLAITAEEIERYKLVKHDLLLTEGGDPDKLGRGAVWAAKIFPCVHQNHIFRVRVLDNELVLPRYLSDLIGSQYGKMYFLRAAKQTTGIATINKTQLREFPVLLPPINIQKKYQAIVSRCEEAESKLGHILEMQNTLFGALAQRAFRGDLIESEAA